MRWTGLTHVRKAVSFQLTAKSPRLTTDGCRHSVGLGYDRGSGVSAADLKMACDQPDSVLGDRFAEAFENGP